MTRYERAALTATVGWRISGHARSKAAARGFEVREILLAAAEPEVAYEQSHYGTGRFMHQRGDAAVAVDVASRTVITVLWRHETHWTDAEAQHRDRAPSRNHSGRTRPPPARHDPPPLPGGCGSWPYGLLIDVARADS